MINEVAFYMCLFLLVLGKITEKKFFNPITMFYSLWACILALSSLRLFNLLKARNEIYWLIFTGLISFAIGYYFYKVLIIIYGKSRKNINDENIKYELNYNVVYFLAFICIIFYLKDIAIVLEQLLGGKSLEYIRALAQDSSSVLYSSKSKIESALKILYITPFVQALQPIVAVDIFFGKRDKKLFILNIVIIGLKVISDGGRSMIIYLLISILVAFSINEGRKRIHKIKISKFKQNVIIVFLVCIILFIIYKITESRSGENILRFAYYYFGMQPIMFDRWAEIVDSTGIYGMGITATNGIWFAIFYVLRNIFSIGYPEFWSNIYALIEGTGTYWQTITEMGTKANSFVSAFWVLYVDGRLYGIIVGMFIYGMIISKSYMSAIRKKSLKHISIYMFLYIGLFYTFVRLQFANIYYDIALVFLIFVMYRKKRRKK